MEASFPKNVSIAVVSFFTEENLRGQQPLNSTSTSTSHHELTVLFMKTIEHRKDAVLEYADGLLRFHQADSITCKKILNSLICASNNRATWVLEELVLRPVALHSILFAPIQIPSHIQEDFYGHFAETEDWWQFWEKIPAACTETGQVPLFENQGGTLRKNLGSSAGFDWCADLDSVENVRSMSLA
jgi:hypothetical protein